MKDRLQQITRVGAVAATMAFPQAVESSPRTTSVDGGQASSAAHLLDQEMPSQMVFASNRDGNYEIYLKDLATGQDTNLTNNPADDLNPQVSPDGQTVVFYSNREDEVNQIYKLSMEDPSSVERLTNFDSNDYDPTFSPDGTNIAYKTNRDDGYGDIWLMNADGSNQHNLTSKLNNAEEQQRDFSQTEEWKPDFIDDNHIVFTSRTPDDDSNSDELFTVDISTGKSSQLTDNNVPDWFPDVDYITGKLVFISKEKPEDHDALYTMNLDGTDRVKVTDLPEDSDDPSWSPDSKKMTFVNNQSGNYDIYTMNADGRDVELVQESPDSTELSPSFVPQT